MIICKLAIFISIYLLGEILFNYTWFKYLKMYFKSSVKEQEKSSNEMDKMFLYLNISTFKGCLERFIISTCLINLIPSILIVFGALKLGTRFREDAEIKNDYFLIGNLSSILIAVLYNYLYFQLYSLIVSDNLLIY